MNLSDIQAALREANLDGWLFYDHHRRDPIAYRVLNISPVMCTRRWYYFIPEEGEPGKISAPDRVSQPRRFARHGGTIFFLARTARGARTSAAR